MLFLAIMLQWVKDTCLRDHPTKTRSHRFMFAIYECPKCGSLVERAKTDSKRKNCGCTKTVISNKRERDLYKPWINLNNRCYVKSHGDYPYYGGKGIEVCNLWKRGEVNGFKNFVSDMENTYFVGATIDRKNSNGNYEKDNCQWLTRAENSRLAHTGRQHTEEEKRKRSSSLRKIDLDKAKIINDFLLNNSLEKAAIEFKISSSTIRDNLKRFGLRIPNKYKGAK